jgi:HEAT repeat protein
MKARLFLLAGLLALSCSPARAADISDPLVSLKDPNPAVRRAAIDRVVYQDMRAGLGALRRALTDPNVLVRESAAWALGQMRDAAAAPELIGRWKAEKSLLVKSAIVDAFAKIRGEEAPGVLQEAFRARSPLLSRPAAIGLGLIGDWPAARVLLDRVRDPSPRVREAVALALVFYEETDAKAALANLALDPVEAVKNKAVLSLKLQEKGPGFLEAAAGALKSPDPSVRRVAAHLLGLWGPLKESRPALANLDEHDLQPEVRLESRLALAELDRRQKEADLALAKKKKAEERAKARKEAARKAALRKRKKHIQNVPVN